MLKLDNKPDCGTCLNRHKCNGPADPLLSECYSYSKDPEFIERRPDGPIVFNEERKKMGLEPIRKKGNQNAKSDAGKAKLSLVPTDIIWAIAAIREYGNNKYPDGGPDNWKQVERERYIDACYRHWLRFVKDPTGVDTESGYPHLWHCACNVAFLCEMYAEELKKYK